MGEPEVSAFEVGGPAQLPDVRRHHTVQWQYGRLSGGLRLPGQHPSARFLVGLSPQNHTFRVAADATHLAVHVFDIEHIDLVELFGSQTGDETNKFDRCRWHRGPAGLPILDDAAAWFVGKILDRFCLGDHVGHLLEPLGGDPPTEEEEWVSFDDVRSLDPGHEA